MPISLKEILVICFVLAVLGLIAYLVNRAPFIEATFKTFIVWALIVVGAIYLIWTVAGLLGVS